MSSRMRAEALLMVFGLAMVLPAVAFGAAWKSVTPSAKFITYAQHAHDHGMQAWYPRRLPNGFTVNSLKSGTSVGMDGEARPYCRITFKKGGKRIYLVQQAYVGVDVPSVGTVPWGGKRAEWYGAWGAVWLGPDSEQAELHDKGVATSDVRKIAKYMRTVR